jgi:uncharacterized cupredoxin-like copper-binding protein
MIKVGSAFALAVAAFVLVPLAYAAAPAQTVKVQLQDSGAAMTGMNVVVDHQKVKAGRVTLMADNQSKNLVHEVVVVAVKSAAQALPYNEKTQQVVESRIRKLGEIADLKPGAGGKLTLNLRPGTYLLICNQPGHYKAGMSATLIVEK